MKLKKNPRNPGSGNPSVKNHKGWTDDEKKKLRKLKSEGLENVEIAKKLNRTLYSVLSVITTLGLANKKHSASARAARLKLERGKKKPKSKKPAKVHKKATKPKVSKSSSPKAVKPERVDLTTLPPATSV